MKITDVECHVLLAPNYDPSFTSSAQDSFLVLIHTDEGLTGLGESDVNPWMAKACIEAPGTHTMGQSIKEMLIGADPDAIEAIWQKLYVGTAMNGRRGAVVHAIGAVDMALWDLRGQVAGQADLPAAGPAARHAGDPLRLACSRPAAASRPIATPFAPRPSAPRRWAFGRSRAR